MRGLMVTGSTMKAGREDEKEVKVRQRELGRGRTAERLQGIDPGQGRGVVPEARGTASVARFQEPSPAAGTCRISYVTQFLERGFWSRKYGVAGRRGSLATTLRLDNHELSLSPGRGRRGGRLEVGLGAGRYQTGKVAQASQKRDRKTDGPTRDAGRRWVCAHRARIATRSFNLQQSICDWTLGNETGRARQPRRSANSTDPRCIRIRGPVEL